MKRLITSAWTRHAVFLLLMMAIPCLAAPTWRVTVKVERPGSSHADSMRVHFAKHDSVKVDVWSILEPLELGWMIVDNDEGTQYVVTAPDTIPIIGPIRSALGKYNQRVTVRKERVEKIGGIE